MSSKVGGIARAPVWGANPFLNENNHDNSYVILLVDQLPSWTDVRV